MSIFVHRKLKLYTMTMHKNFFRTFSLSFIIALLFASPAAAAKPSGPGGGGGSTTNTLGMDISYPQCGKKVPTDQAFGIVGVNGGNAATVNSCLAQQLVWAGKSSGAVPAQDVLQLYVNTANPGQVKDQMTSKWPESNSGIVHNPYGTCSGANDQACSWEYGWGRGQFAADYFVAQAGSVRLDSNVSKYKWWLDVETMNTWQTGSQAALANNTAALEGWVDFFKHKQARVGLYSTAYQWGQIVGSTVSATSNLNGLDNWRPGGANLSTAKQACGAAPLTPGGKVILTQFVSKNLDYDYSCI